MLTGRLLALAASLASGACAALALAGPGIPGGTVPVVGLALLAALGSLASALLPGGTAGRAARSAPAMTPPTPSPPPPPAPPPAAPAVDPEAVAREAKLARLRELVADSRRRLAFATAIIASVPGKTEEAAFALMSRFEDLRGNAVRAATIAREAKATLEGSKGHPPVGLVAESTRTAVKAEREAVQEVSELNRRNAKELRGMGKELESGLGLLKGIEEITERSRLIAFNMAVEAARIGEKGRGFKVIVGELRSLNDRTVEFSRRVAELLGRFRDYNAAMVTRMAEGSERVMTEVEKGMDATEASLESLIEASAQTDRIARDVASMAEGIDRDLDGVLESLQFQDITRQMIEGGLVLVAEAASDVTEAGGMANPAGAEDGARERAAFEAVRREALGRSRTKGEKEAIMEVKP